MALIAYAVALLTRGAGLYAYTYTGPGGLARGRLCAVSFRGRLELGAVLGEDSQAPADRKLMPLWPADVPVMPAWGGLLLDLAELSESTPRQVAGHLLFAAPAQGLRLKLSVPEPAELPARLRGEAAALAGTLTPAKRKQLMALDAWEELVQAAAEGALGLEVGIAGLPAETRPHARLRHRYAIDSQTARLLGLSGSGPSVLPGSYLAGLIDELDPGWPRAKAARDAEDIEEVVKPPATRLRWEDKAWPDGWALHDRWPALGETSLSRTQATWRELGAADGLTATLAAAAAEGRNVLLVAPLGWMLERIWPQLAPWADRVHRYRSEAGPSAAALMLGALERGGQIVCGLAGAWKLAAYGRFDEVILLDPTHPQFEPEGDPWLDPRLALLLALRRSGARLRLIEMGLSALDGTSLLDQAVIMPPAEPPPAEGHAEQPADIDPLPLRLRQPDVRRLVYFNRLGLGRGLRCVECGRRMVCPQCGDSRVYGSSEGALYRCRGCGWQQAGLRCPDCGTATLAMGFAGIEALYRRAGDVLVSAAAGKHQAPGESGSVFGTAQLLTPIAGFWPQQIVYVHADVKPALLDDWPGALDMLARLKALYDNPRLKGSFAVGARLSARLGTELSAAQLTELHGQELALRRLAGLPPYGRVCHFRWRARDPQAAWRAGKTAIEQLLESTAREMLWLGRPFRRRDGFHLLGYAVNPELDHRGLQLLRDMARRNGATLSIRAQWGPWL